MNLIRKYLILIICLSFLNAGCVEELIIDTYRRSETKRTNEKFMEQFNQNNIERKKAGLPPLDLCTEKYHFDEKWADDDPECKERISRYEAGDTTALGNTELSEPNQENTDTIEPKYERTGNKQPVEP